MINNNNNLSDIGSISATTYYGDGSNLTGVSVSGGTYWTAGSGGVYSVKALNDSGLDASADYSYAEGYGTLATNPYSHAEGKNTASNGIASHTEGSGTTANGNMSHAEGQDTMADGDGSHAEGIGTQTHSNTVGGHAEGGVTQTYGDYAHAEGYATTSNSTASHAEGGYTSADGIYSHAEGEGTIAAGVASHAEGYYTESPGNHSHSGGWYTFANGLNSFVHGSGSTASGINTIVLGSGITGITDNTTYVNSLIGTTISATTYNNLPTDITVTGGTYSSGTTEFTNTTGGTFNVTGYPTKTSDLTNDGDNGLSHFISLEDLPSNIIMYPTTGSSDIGGYLILVTDINDPSYNTTAVDVSTGSITTTSQLISSLATSTNIIVGNPGTFNITTVGNIRRTAGSGEANFYFEAYKRTSGGTETLVATSSNSLPVSSGTYIEFSATALFNNGDFLSTDRIVLKFYGNRIAGGSNPTYDFQFGGTTPVRTALPVPLVVIPSSYVFTGGTVNGATNFTNGLTANTISATTYSNLPVQTGSFGITIDGGGAVITTGLKGFIEIPYSGTITRWTILSDVAGSCVIDIWKDTYANFPPTSGDTITASAKPTLTSAVKAQSSTLTGWTTAVTAGDIIGFNVNSVSTSTRINLSVNITKS